MYAVIELNKKLVEQPEINVHFIPASIEGEGKINIKEHFDLYTRTSQNQSLSNALRGHPLVGEKVTLPTTMQTFILQEQMVEGSSSLEMARKFQSRGTLSEFNYWTYDNSNECRQHFQELLDFPQIAQVVSSNNAV